MDISTIIKQRVHNYYWNFDINCATTTLKILSEIHSIELSQQVINSATGLHGAGKYGAQCGLVEGALMFIGIYGKEHGMNDLQIEELCYRYTSGFQENFGSLECRELRPEGFKPTNPPHICENLSINTISYTNRFILDNIK